MNMGQCRMWGTYRPKEPHRRRYAIWIRSSALQVQKTELEYKRFQWGKVSRSK